MTRRSIQLELDGLARAAFNARRGDVDAKARAAELLRNLTSEARAELEKRASLRRIKAPTPENLLDDGGVNLEVLRSLCTPAGDLYDEDLDVGDPFQAPYEVGQASSWRETWQRAEPEREERRRREERSQERWDSRVDGFLARERVRRPHEWIFSWDVIDIALGLTMALMKVRLKYRPAGYAWLARAIARGDFMVDGQSVVHWLPAEYARLRAEGPGRLTPEGIVRLARRYSPGGGGGEIFENRRFQMDVMERLAFRVSASPQWRFDNGKLDLPPKYQAEEASKGPTSVVPSQSAAPKLTLEIGAKKAQQHAPEQDALLRNKIMKVHAKARSVFSVQVKPLDVMAEELAKPEHQLSFKRETIRQILNGTYRPALRLGIGPFKFPDTKQKHK
jgi:hypothetical protein